MLEVFGFIGGFFLTVGVSHQMISATGLWLISDGERQNPLNGGYSRFEKTIRSKCFARVALIVTLTLAALSIITNCFFPNSKLVATILIAFIIVSGIFLTVILGFALIRPEALFGRLGEAVAGNTTDTKEARNEPGQSRATSYTIMQSAIFSGWMFVLFGTILSFISIHPYGLFGAVIAFMTGFTSSALAIRRTN